MTEDLLREDDLAFQLHDVLKVTDMLAWPRFAEHDREVFDQVLASARAIAEEKFRPHNRAADLAEPHLENGKVVLLPEVKEALDAFFEAGFAAGHHDEEIGGMQLPWTIQQAAFSYFKAANISSIAYAFLTIAATNLLLAHGSASQKRRYLEPMLAGRFFGTMMLSEPHAGSSLSDVRTKAVPTEEEGVYRVSGSKMWISGGQQEMSENIVHMVLARIEGAPSGVKGLSLFAIPRYRVGEDGAIGADNDVRVAGLNHKMGYRGTVNTVMALGENGDCLGEIVGAPGRGLAGMFHMMNEARIGVALGAVMLAYTGYRHSLTYARERPQGRHPGDKDPTSPQVPLIEHADIRRLLLVQKTAAEGGLSLALFTASLIDRQKNHPDEAVQEDARRLLDVLTPVLKSWFSDRALEANTAAIQILGGYGYTRDYPVEQFWRDNRLNPIHEGTNGIQAIDLLGRKTVIEEGRGLDLLHREIVETIAAARAQSEEADGRLAAEALMLEAMTSRHRQVTEKLTKARADLGDRAVLANATAYMEFTGRVVEAWIWLRQAVVAGSLLGDEGLSGARRQLMEGKIHACRWYFATELPKAGPAADLLDRLDPTAFAMEDAWF